MFTIICTDRLRSDYLSAFKHPIFGKSGIIRCNSSLAISSVVRSSVERAAIILEPPLHVASIASGINKKRHLTQFSVFELMIYDRR